VTTTFFNATRGHWTLAVLLSLCTLIAAPASAQDPAPPQSAPAQDPAATQPPPAQADPDARVDPLQPDFNLAALPVTLRMPVHKLDFRVTHRFTRSLGAGDFGDLLANFFGFDSGAQIGLELRYGLFRGNQIGVHRTSSKTIQIFDQHSFWQERDGHPLGLDSIVTLEGTNNMKDQLSTALGVVASRKVAGVLALYAEPIYLVNTNPNPGDSVDHNDTLMLGLGTRVRVRPAMYLFGEITPRLWGYQPGEAQASFGVEFRSGGHLFQINFSNGVGTTLGQLAHNGGIDFDSGTWFIGFNIARKFF
jgi:uncharacterized beta barrel domain-containing protein DUF5777